jgi:hypothetical protein
MQALLARAVEMLLDYPQFGVVAGVVFLLAGLTWGIWTSSYRYR